LAFYTKPTNLQKGQDNLASLDKSQLLLESKVSNDSYYSDSSNWNYVVVTYKSVGGNQLSNVIFDASLENPTASFYITEKARDVWEVKSVRIDDFDGGYLSFDRNELTVSDFDLSFLPPEPTQLVITQQFTSGLAGDVITPSLTVELRDIDNNLVTTATNEVTLSLDTDPSSGSSGLSGTLVKNAVNGIVTFDDISITNALDNYIFQSQSTGFTPVIFNPLNVLPNLASQLSYVIQPPSEFTEETVIAPSIQVEIIDDFGNRVSDNNTVTLNIGNDPAGSTGLYGTLSKNAVNGFVQFDDILLDITVSGGTQNGFTFIVSSTGLLSATSNPFNVIKLTSIFNNNPNNTVSNETISPAIEASLFDSNLQVPTNIVDQLRVELGNDPTGNAILSGTLTKSTINGTVSFDDLSIDNIGSGYTLNLLRETPSGFVTEATTTPFNIESNLNPIVNFTRDFSNPNFIESNELLIGDNTNGSFLIYNENNQLEYTLLPNGNLVPLATYRRNFDDDGQTLEVGADYLVEIDIDNFTANLLETGDRIVIYLGGFNTGTILYDNIINGTNSPISPITVNTVLNNRVNLDFSTQSTTVGKEVYFTISAIRITKVV